MKFRWDKKYLYWGITAFLVIVGSICFFLLLNRFNEVVAAMNFLGDILMPFMIGLVIAYLLNPIVEFFENKCFTPLCATGKRAIEKRWPASATGTASKKQSGSARKKPSVSDGGAGTAEQAPVLKSAGAPRVLAIIVTVILALAIVTGLLGMVLPQLINSIYGIAQNLPAYFNRMEQWAIEISASYPGVGSFLEDQFSNISEFLSGWMKNNLLPQLNELLNTLTSGVMGFVSGLMDLFVGLIAAIYVLFSKEKFVAQTKKLTYALFTVKGANLLLRITRRADGMFGGFIKGKLIDSTIIGLLCFLGMTFLPFLNNPYNLLIAVMIGVTNIIPFFGPFIGAVPSAILILMIDPWKCLWFILFIVVLQQLDGNVIGPRILSGSTGLSSFWIIFSIMLFGGLFGFVGMVIGVPAFALIYSLIDEFVTNRLRNRALPSTTEEYSRIDHIDSEEKQPVFVQLPSSDKPAGN